MIYNILSAIAKQLQVGLADIVTQPDTQVEIQPVRSGRSLNTLPMVYLIPDAFELAAKNLDSSCLQTSTVLPSEIKVQKPFQQGFWLEVYGQDAIATEQLASLAMGILLTCSNELVQASNQSNGRRSKTLNRYQSTQFTTQHYLQQIQLQGGEPCVLKDKPGFCIRGRILGQLEAIRQINEGEIPIQTVSLEYSLSE